MTTQQGSTGVSRRLHELEEEFAALEAQIPESPTKQALSLLHGIVQERWRGAQPADSTLDGQLLAADIAEMYREAPPMEGPAVTAPLPAGTVAPDFTLPDANNQPISLSDFRGRPLVIVFYPLDWSPGCSQQLDIYQQELDEFERRGTKIVGISVDSIYSHGAWAAVRGITFPLLSDFHPHGEVARRYGVWRDRDGFSERALYVIDGDGVIRYSHVSPQLHHIPDVYELLDAVDSAATATV